MYIMSTLYLDYYKLDSLNLLKIPSDRCDAGRFYHVNKRRFIWIFVGHVLRLFRILLNVRCMFVFVQVYMMLLMVND
jgi:hypothetical protein